MAKELTRELIEEKVCKALIEASTVLTHDKVCAYEASISGERSERAKWVMGRILESSKISEEKGYPLCNDTGTPHVYIKAGSSPLPAHFFESIKGGIALGLRRLPGRAMAVRGEGWKGLEQRQGLYEDPAKVLPPPMVVRSEYKDRDGCEKIEVTVLMLGGGPELRSRTYRVFHLNDCYKILGEIKNWALEELPKLGCTPGVLAVGIGRSHYEASVEVMRAMVEGDLGEQTAEEKWLTDQVNSSGIGPLSLGGGTTLLGSFVRIGELRASGARIVSMRPCCCYEPRRSSIELRA
jgi:fumarate hydratase subunit alpha